jgi:Uma2 family endonuclease
LIDGVLVEKIMGLRESILAAELIRLLGNFVRAHRLGVVAGEAGMMRLAEGLVRIPDVSFISAARLPGGKIPREPVPRLAPDLAVEVLSEGNTSQEMARKRQEYFEAGVQLVWEIDPRQRTVTVYASPEEFSTFGETNLLDGGDVLPGFTLSLAELFAELDR